MFRKIVILRNNSVALSHRGDAPHTASLAQDAPGGAGKAAWENRPRSPWKIASMTARRRNYRHGCRSTD